MTLILEDGRRALLMHRHRWIIDQWVWELPGRYVDHAENGPQRPLVRSKRRPAGAPHDGAPGDLSARDRYSRPPTGDPPRTLGLPHRHPARHQRNRIDPMGAARGSCAGDRTWRDRRSGDRRGRVPGTHTDSRQDRPGHEAPRAPAGPTRFARQQPFAGSDSAAVAGKRSTGSSEKLCTHTLDCRQTAKAAFWRSTSPSG